MWEDNTLQRVVHAVGMHIAEAKRDHTGQPGSTRGDQLPEAEIMDQHNTSLLPSLLHNAWVWEAFQSLVREMHRIVPKGLEEGDGFWGNAHIGQKFHGRTGSNGWTVSSASQAT